MSVVRALVSFIPVIGQLAQDSTACRFIWKAVVRRDYLPLLSVFLHKTLQLLQDGFCEILNFGFLLKFDKSR